MRQENEPHEDLRQRRTRKFLVNALMELMEQRPFGEISVVDICQRAMVHRTTFYAHFDDKTALFRYAVTEMQREFEAAVPDDPSLAGPKEFFLKVARNVLGFMRQHRQLYQTGVSGCSGLETQLLEELVAAQILNRIASPDFYPREPGFVPEIAAHFYAGAVLSLIRWWLEHQMPVSDEVLLNHLSYFIPLQDTGRKADDDV